MAAWTVDLIGMPPSVNRIWRYARSGRAFKTAIYNRWLKFNTELLKLTFSGKRFPHDRCEVIIEIVGGSGWSMSRDIDNCIKATLDLFVTAGTIADDNCRIVRRIAITYSDPVKKKDPAICRVTIIPAA